MAKVEISRIEKVDVRGVEFSAAELQHEELFVEEAWVVVNRRGEIIATCRTNAEAWRAYDKLMGEDKYRRRS